METQTLFPPVEVKAFRGQNSANNLADLPFESQALAKNAMMREIGTMGKRDGSAPVIETALGDPISHLMIYPFEQDVDVGSAPSLAPVGDAASTLVAGTYYARYTHVTDDGETEASAEASVVVPPAVANPTLAPTLAESADGGETLPDQEYFVAYTWKNAVGETMVSPEDSFTVTAGNKLDITIPALPTGATSASIYVGTVTGTLYFQANIVITTHSITEPIDEVTPPPVANTCIAAKLRVTVPAVPFHANSTNVYISATTNTEKLEGSTITTTFDQSTPLDGTVAYPTVNTTSFRADLLAVSDDTVYSFYDEELHAATMTDVLESDDVYDADFTGINSGALVNIKILADGGDLKQFNGTTVVDVTPASDDSSPAPANVLDEVNLLGIKYVWVFSQHTFMCPGDNQMWFSKRAGASGTDSQYNYVPETHYLIAVRKGDYINGPGIPFDDVCFVPMRHGWNVITGTFIDDFDSGEFLNTINGLIAPRSAQIITYANGQQTIAYLSDDGCHEIFTTVLDNRGKQYATRSIMSNLIDFESYGFTEAEKTAAIGKFIVKFNSYLLEITRDTTDYLFVFDTRDGEWRVWYNLSINSFIEREGIVYFAGDDGFLKKFDEGLYTDWEDFDQTTGDPVDFDVYSGLLSFGFDGHAAYLDYYLIEAKQWLVESKLDIYITYGAGVVEVPEALTNTIFQWGITAWSEAEWANTAFTDIVNNSRRIILKKKGFYFQRRMRNNRNEPVLVYKEKYMGRTSNKG